jgi:hypothetical protein
MKDKISDSFKSKMTKMVISYLKENEKLLIKYNISVSPIINFPKKHKVPTLSKIALWIVKKQGGILDLNYKILNKQIK